MIAALYVETDGIYFGRADVDPWDKPRDARTYSGPHSVVAHPPCERWGRYWSGGPSARVKRTLGDDDGCFAAALSSVRRYGGVLEHPEASKAFKAHGLAAPPWLGGWVGAGDGQGRVCCVAQGNYGHPARKMTWLYHVGGVHLPDLRWGPSEPRVDLDSGFYSKEERRRATRTGVCQRLSARQRRQTPPHFADLLILLASR